MVLVTRITVFLTALFMLAACDQQHEPFTIYVENDVTIALSVDLIAVNDTSVGATIHAAGADSWFSNKQALMAQYSGRISVRHYQIPPGDVNENAQWPNLPDAQMFIIAIAYPEKRELMALDANTVRRIVLGRAGISIQS